MHPPTPHTLLQGLLGQDEDLHDEDAAEDEAGAGHVVLEGRQRGGPVLLRNEGGGRRRWVKHSVWATTLGELDGCRAAVTTSV